MFRHVGNAASKSEAFNASMHIGDRQEAGGLSDEYEGRAMKTVGEVR
jgi:hypothetical protein